MMVALCSLYVFFMVYLTPGLGDISICSSKRQVTASVGDSAFLSCYFLYGKSNANLTVVWRKTKEDATDLVVHNQKKYETFNNQSAAYLNRTAMYKDWSHRKDATLTVDRIRPADDGEYSCWIIQSSPRRITTYKCCTIRLYVAQESKGDKKQLVVVWSIYIMFLSLCLLILYRCSQKKS